MIQPAAPRNPKLTPDQVAMIDNHRCDRGQKFDPKECQLRHYHAKKLEAVGRRNSYEPCGYCPLVIDYIAAEKAAENQERETTMARKPNRVSDKTCETCGKRLTINGHCMSCNARKARSKSEEKPLKISKRVARQFEKAVEKPAPKIGAKKSICNEPAPKVTQEKSNVTFAPKTLPNLPASQLCKEYQIQNCHDCDDLACDDNMRKPAADTIHATQLPGPEEYALANPPKRAQLLSLHTTLTEQARELMTRKNADYGANADPFANFRMSALLHIEPEFGVLLRMQDKMARLVSFLEKGELAVKEESWSDAIIDIINYSVLLCGLLQEKVNQGGANL